jgi:hypothetical protein
MRSDKESSSVPRAPSSPADSATERPRTRPNAFDLEFLERLLEMDEPPAAQEAEWAGPWLLDPSPDGDFAFYRLGESAKRGHQPWARFRNQSEAVIAMALLTCRREAAYRLSPTREALGYPVRSRPGWCETVAWLSVFDEEWVQGFSFLEALLRSPQALSYLLEAAGGTVLERAGAILEERLRP